MEKLGYIDFLITGIGGQKVPIAYSLLLKTNFVVAFLEEIFRNTFFFGEDQKEALSITVLVTWSVAPSF